MIPKSINTRKRRLEVVESNMNRVQDWTKIYCSNSDEMEKVRSNRRFTIPILITVFSKMIKEKSKSRIALEFICKNAYNPTIISVKWEEIEPMIDAFIEFYKNLEDFEECQTLVDLKAEFLQAEFNK